jgi:hypothetical protein
MVELFHTLIAGLTVSGPGRSINLTVRADQVRFILFVKFQQLIHSFLVHQVPWIFVEKKKKNKVSQKYDKRVRIDVVVT